MAGAIDWGTVGQSAPRAGAAPVTPTFSGSRINWGALHAKAASGPQYFNVGAVTDVPHLNQALKSGQISKQEWQNQFKVIQNKQPGNTPIGGYKLSDALHNAGTQLRQVAQGTARSIPTIGAGVEQLVTGKPTTLQPNKVGQFFYGKAPIQSPQVQGAGAQASHPGGFHIPGTPITLNPSQTGLAETLSSVAQNAPVVAGLAKTATKVGARVAESALAAAGKDTGVNDLLGAARLKALQPVKPTPAAPVKAGLGEAGAVNPGAVVKDTQAMITKHNNVVNATGNIAEDYAKTQGRTADIKLDVAKVLKNRTPLSNVDKQTLLDYRDAKSAGLTPAPLPDHLQAADANITSLNKAAQAADVEKAKLSDQPVKAAQIAARDPETYTHRIAQDKGSNLDYTVRGDRNNPLSIGSLSKTTAGSKKQVFMNATDEAGNRTTVAVKQGKVTAFEGGKPSTSLGNLNLKTNQDFLDKELQPYQTKINNLQKEGDALSKVKASGGASDARITKLAQKVSLLEDPQNMTGLTKPEARSLQQAKIKLKELTNVKNAKTNAPNRLNTINQHLIEMNNQVSKIHNKYDPETLDQKSFVAADGKKYTLGQATTSEITKNTGQKYYVDPELTSHLNYADSKVSLENTRFVEGTKKILEDNNIAVKQGETAPKGFQTTTNPYFAGYKMQPKVAEVLDDITAGKKSTGGKLLAASSRVLRNTIIYLPIKHDFNMGAGYIVDRGLTSWLNPVAYGRMGKSLITATKEVVNQGPLYRQMLREGSPLVTADDKELAKVVQRQVRSMSSNSDKVAQFAKAFGMSPVRAYQAIQKVTVWDVQDILNVARVNERMQGTLFGGKMNFDQALKDSAKYNFQYEVPSRVAGSRVASELLQGKTPLTYFGKYTYDKFRIAKNIVKDTANVSNPKQALHAADKLAAAVAISAVLWPQVDKGLQKITGDKNAHITAPGVTSIPELIQQIAQGKKGVTAAAGSQISVALPVNVSTQLHDNTDSFTGKRIWDVNESTNQKAKDIAKWLGTQLPPAQKFKSGQNATQNKTLSTALSLAGASTPKNSPYSNKVKSLANDSLPIAQDKAKAAAKSGSLYQAQQILNDYNNRLLTAAKADLKSQGQPIPNDKTLIEQLKKSRYYYQPKQSTMQKWTTPKPVKAGTFSP